MQAGDDQTTAEAKALRQTYNTAAERLIIKLLELPTKKAAGAIYLAYQGDFTFELKVKCTLCPCIFRIPAAQDDDVVAVQRLWHLLE